MFLSVMRYGDAFRELFRCLVRVVLISCTTRSDAFHTCIEMPCMTRARHPFHLFKVSFSKGRLFRPPLTLLTQEGKRILRLTEVHAASPKGGAEICTPADPEVQVAQCTGGRLGFWEVAHSQLRLPVGTDFECFQMSWFWVEKQIYDIDLRRLLLRRGLTLEQRTDVDR